RSIAWLGTGSVGLAFIVAILIAIETSGGPGARVFSQFGWTWFDIAGFTPRIGLYLDALSMVMVLVVTGVSFVIHLYSVQYIADDEGVRRFFAYMNLF